MYLLGIYFDNARRNRDGKFLFPVNHDCIAKWQILPAGPVSHELLQLMALACGGAPFITRLPFDLGTLHSCSALRIEFILAPHPKRDSRYTLPKMLGSGLQIEAGGRVRALAKKECRLLPAGLCVRKPAYETGNRPYFVVGYGSRLVPHDQTDDFDFSDPFFRVTRFHSLFNHEARITDPIAFLKRLNYRAATVSRYPAKWTLQQLCAQFKKYLDIDTSGWLHKEYEFFPAWNDLRPRQRKLLLPVLDVVRHCIDASPFVGEPLAIQGVMLMDRPDRICSQRVFPSLIRLINALFPQMQVVVTLAEHARERFPEEIYETRLNLPQPVERKRTKSMVKAKSGAVVLIQMDGRLPNLALMKLSRHFKDQGRRVHLARKDMLVPGADAAYASSIFTSPWTAKKIDALREYYGSSLSIGGSGVDVRLRLPGEIENLRADYSLYPELRDRAMGFLTRGCCFTCPFCIVPQKEGPVRRVSDLDDLLESGRRSELILLDDNLLSHPRADKLLEEMAARNLQVNFNQTLDIRLVDRGRAGLLRRIQCSNVHFTRRVIHFSLNDVRDLARVRRNYALFGFTPADNVEFICMYGFDTSLAQDVERFRFLRTLPGAYVFVQEYRPVPGGPEPDLTGFFDGRADRLIDELVAICFSQNMKSMEKYYRWLSRRYVQAFGRIHPRLVNTIFRYNHRDKKGKYLQRMAGLVSKSSRCLVPFSEEDGLQ